MNKLISILPFAFPNPIPSKLSKQKSQRDAAKWLENGNLLSELLSEPVQEKEKAT
jgi:hypothetical protein